jgi:cellulose synthase/poly-beta-1,6-N-acetylglucosamine synthase-like glycosyltransferase
MVLLYVIIVLFVVYAFLIIYFWRSWVAIPEFEVGEKYSTEKISVIIPARNEEDNIGILLQCLKRQSYPSELTEIIVIDDHSTDQTARIVESFAQVKLIRLTGLELNSYKKKAIETGIDAATGSLVVTTDADCRPKDDWLYQIASFKNLKQSVFVAAPVVIHCGPSVLEVFQALDFMVLQGITGASVHKNVLNMCNGANLAYERAAFVEVGGFSGADHIASGDDMLLMQKISDRYPGRLHYLKSNEAIVMTDPAASWKEFFNQRIRWASKALHYKSPRIFLILLLVYLVNLNFGRISFLHQSFAVF